MLSLFPHLHTTGSNSQRAQFVLWKREIFPLRESSRTPQPRFAKLKTRRCNLPLPSPSSSLSFSAFDSWFVLKSSLREHTFYSLHPYWGRFSLLLQDWSAVQNCGFINSLVGLYIVSNLVKDFLNIYVNNSMASIEKCKTSRFLTSDQTEVCYTAILFKI